MKSVNLNKLSNAEFVAYMADVVTLYNRIPQPTLAPFVADLTTALIDLDAAYQIERANILTQEVQELDERRDYAIRGIKRVLEGYLLHFDEPTKRAADLLLRSMNKYNRRIDKLNYKEQTAAVKSLINDWTNDVTLSDSITLLNLLPWQQELATANTDFNTIYMDRVQDDAAKQVVPVSRQREPVGELYNNLERKTVAYHEIDPTTYNELITGLEELIEKYREDQ